MGILISLLMLEDTLYNTQLNGEWAVMYEHLICDLISGLF